MFFKKLRIHFIGIGGAGMCPMAEIMVHNGHRVSGSDQQQSAATDRLISLGVRIQFDHEVKFVRDAELVVYSSAIRPTNKECVYAHEHGIACIKRAVMLGDMMRAYFSIGIAGTHGKTTTTSLIGSIFREAGSDPLVIVGGAFRESASNAMIGNGRLLVAEADEYDRSFLSMYPAVAVVTNIEADHLDIYKDLEDIVNAFIAFINAIPFYGMVVICEDDPVSVSIRSRIRKPVVTYGIAESAQYRAGAIQFEKDRSLFTVFKNNEELCSIAIPLLGMHNIRNALAALATACEMNVPIATIQQSLSSFGGMKRRFEIVGIKAGITVVDDYAHHPSEIQATLLAARNCGYTRLIAVFQPHLYSRTRDFLDAFAESLMTADMAIVTDIYKAREEAIEGVSGQAIVSVMQEKGFQNAHFLKDVKTLPEMLLPLLQEGDGVILMGAGDIGKIGGVVLQRISHE